MKMPSFNSNSVKALYSALTSTEKLRDLENESEEVPVIPTGCPTLDWMTDCGGIPRGRIIEIAGPESSGKCVSLDTLVPVQGRGLLTMGEILSQVEWKKDEDDCIPPDSTAPATLSVYSTKDIPEETNGVYYAGITDNVQINTQSGLTLTGTHSHRVLVLPDNGIFRWTHLKDVRPSDVILQNYGHRVSGDLDKLLGHPVPKNPHIDPENTKSFSQPTSSVNHPYPDDTSIQVPLNPTLEEATALLFGALSTAELRNEEWSITVTSSRQRKYIEDWASIVYGGKPNPFDEHVDKIGKFSGIMKFHENWASLVEMCVNHSPSQIRRCSIQTQVLYCTGALLVKGQWTANDLEFEIPDTQVGRTLQHLLHNIGILTLGYECLNAFSQKHYKIALRDRIAQQLSNELLFKNVVLPSDWEGRYVLEKDETHPYLLKTLSRAKEVILNTKAGCFDLSNYDFEDIDKDNLLLIAKVFRPYVRTKTEERIFDTLITASSPNTNLDIISSVEKLQIPAPTADLSVPNGHSYTTNGLMSHNSTLAMHLCFHPDTLVEQGLGKYTPIQDIFPGDSVIDHTGSPAMVNKTIISNNDSYTLEVFQFSNSHFPLSCTKDHPFFVAKELDPSGPELTSPSPYKSIFISDRIDLSPDELNNLEFTHKVTPKYVPTEEDFKKQKFEDPTHSDFKFGWVRAEDIKPGMYVYNTPTNLDFYQESIFRDDLTTPEVLTFIEVVGLFFAVGYLSDGKWYIPKDLDENGRPSYLEDLNKIIAKCPNMLVYDKQHGALTFDKSYAKVFDHYLSVRTLSYTDQTLHLSDDLTKRFLGSPKFLASFVKGYFIGENSLQYSILRNTNGNRAKLLGLLKLFELSGVYVRVENLNIDKSLPYLSDHVFYTERKDLYDLFKDVYLNIHLVNAGPSPWVRVLTHTTTCYTGNVYNLEVEKSHTYSTNGVVVHNCALEMESNPNAICVYQDYERSTAVKYAKKMKLHTFKTQDGDPRFHLHLPNIFEEADTLSKAYFKAGIYPAIWVCDSIPAMVPESMFHRDEDQNPEVAKQARMLSDLLSRWIKWADDYGITFILINQVRAYIKTGFTDPGAKAIPGVAGTDKETTPGGNAIKFYSSMRIDLRPKSVFKAKVFNPMTDESEDIPVANLVKATARKNKVGAPYKSGQFFITFGEGIDTPRTMFEMALKKGIIQKSGSSFTLNMGENTLTERGYSEFLEHLKRGPLSREAQKFLHTALDWHRADQVTSEVLDVINEDQETGFSTSTGSVTLSGNAAVGKLKAIRASADLVAQADILGLLAKDKKAITWRNPNTGTELRGGNIASLSKKFRGVDLMVLKQQIGDGIKELEETIRIEENAMRAREAAQARTESSSDTQSSSAPDTETTPENTPDQPSEVTIPEEPVVKSEEDLLAEVLSELDESTQSNSNSAD